MKTWLFKILQFSKVFLGISILLPIPTWGASETWQKSPTCLLLPAPAANEILKLSFEDQRSHFLEIVLQYIPESLLFEPHEPAGRGTYLFALEEGVTLPTLSGALQTPKHESSVWFVEVDALGSAPRIVDSKGRLHGNLVTPKKFEQILEREQRVQQAFFKERQSYREIMLRYLEESELFEPPGAPSWKVFQFFVNPDVELKTTTGLIRTPEGTPRWLVSVDPATQTVKVFDHQRNEIGLLISHEDFQPIQQALEAQKRNDQKKRQSYLEVILQFVPKASLAIERTPWSGALHTFPLAPGVELKTSSGTKVTPYDSDSWVLSVNPSDFTVTVVDENGNSVGVLHPDDAIAFEKMLEEESTKEAERRAERLIHLEILLEFLPQTALLLEDHRRQLRPFEFALAGSVSIPTSNGLYTTPQGSQKGPWYVTVNSTNNTVVVFDRNENILGTLEPRAATPPSLRSRLLNPKTWFTKGGG